MQKQLQIWIKEKSLHVLSCQNQCSLVYLSCKAQMLRRTWCLLLLISNAETFQRICLWCLWMVCLVLLQQPELRSMVGTHSCHSCKQAVQWTLPLQTRGFENCLLDEIYGALEYFVSEFLCIQFQGSSILNEEKGRF